MNIYNPDGSVLIENVPITSSAKHYEEMMKSNYIKLSWNDNEYKILPTGAYIVWHNVHYKLFEDYQPTIKDEAKCVYEPEFQHPVMILDHTPCLFATRNSKGEDVKEPTWVYTGGLQLIVGRIQTIIAEELDVWLDASITVESKTIPTSATISFDGDTIWSALGKICQAWDNEIEFHVVWDITRGTTESVNGCIYIGDIAINDESKGGTATLTDGVNVVTTARQENNKNGFANYYVVRGGTRNITTVTAGGNNVQTDTRMTLNSSKYPGSVIDKRANDNVPKIQDILIFDDIYPSLTLYCYNIRERVRRRQDEDGNYIAKEYNADGSVKSYKMYSVYYMRLAYPTKDTNGNVTAWTEFPFNKSTDIIDGKTLKCSFQANEEGNHSALAGRDFELTYHTADRTIPASTTTGDSGVYIKKGDWEIIFEEDDDFIIPNSDTLQPYGESSPSIKCDTLLLYNILLTGDYLTNAQNKLEASALEEIEYRMTDYDNYTVKSYPHIFKQSKPSLFVGQQVNYTNREGQMDSHIIKIETSLECEYVQTITLGNARITGTITSVRDDVSAMSGVIDVNTSSISSITATLSKTMKQIREWASNFLSRKEDDTAAGHITFDAGLTSNGKATVNNNMIVSGKTTATGGVDIGDLFKFDKSGNIIAHTIASGEYSGEKGWTVAIKDSASGTYKLIIDEMQAWSNATIGGQLNVQGNVIGKTFAPGFLAGKGWGITSREVTNAAGATETKWTGEFDELVVRGSMKVYEMVISQLVGENDNRVFTGMMEVSYYDADSGKVYFSLDNGTSYNPFRTGDYIMVQQFSPSGYDVTKSYELIVTGYGNESINNVQYAWVTFDSFTTGIADGTAESLITEGDTFVRVDSISDPDRKGIVQIITVGTSTPHIDVIHGMKTDSDNSLKVRLGNLEKVTDTNFGTLEGFGLYSNNCYLSGDFVISKTGENVANKFEVLGDKFASQYTSIEDEMTKGDNLLTNGNFIPDSTGQPDVWECSDTNAVSIKSIDDRKVLAFTTSNGKTVSLQLSSGNIKSVPTHKVYNDDGSITEEANDVTLTIKFKGDSINSLTVEYGTTTDGSTQFDAFVNKGTADMDGWYTASTTIKRFNKSMSVSINFSGAGYIEYIRMIPDTTSGMQTEFDSAITQTSKAIALQATELSSTNSKVAEMQVTADGIKSTVSNMSSGTNCNLFGLTKGITFNTSGQMYFYAQAYGIVCTGATEYTLSGLGFRGAGGNFVVTCEVCAGQAMILGASLNGTTSAEGDATIPAETWTAVKFSFTGVTASDDSDKMVIVTNGTAMFSVRHLCVERGTMPAAQWSLSPIDLASCGSSYRKRTFTSAGTSAQDVVNGETTTVYMATKGAQDEYLDALYLTHVAPVTTDSDGSMYTLSFWAKADEKGMVIALFLYGNDNNPNVGYAYTDYLDNGGKQTVANLTDGCTRIYLTTEWRKYYVHWRTLNGEEFHIIPMRFVETENAAFADGSKVYMAGVTFEAGYICEENGGAAASYSKIEQTADKISLSVDDAKTSAENYASELNNKTTTSLKSTGIDIEQGTISMYTDKFALKNRSTNKTVLEADSNGNLSLTGKVSADSGNIGDFEIQNNSLYAAPTASNSWESVQIDGKGIQLDRRQSSASSSVVEYMRMKQESYGYCLTYSDSTLNADVTFGRYDGGDSSFGIMAERVTTENSIEVRKSVGIGTDGFTIATKNTSSTYGTLNYSVSGKVAVQGFSGILCEIGAYISKIGYDTKNKWSVLVLNDLPNYEDKDKLENGQVYIASDGTLRVK